MLTSFTESIFIAIIMTIFNAGGFVWLAFNHFKSTNKKLDDITERLEEISDRLNKSEQDISFIKGRCAFKHEMDEE